MDKSPPFPSRHPIPPVPHLNNCRILWRAARRKSAAHMRGRVRTRLSHESHGGAARAAKRVWQGESSQNKKNRPGRTVGGLSKASAVGPEANDWHECCYLRSLIVVRFTYATIDSAAPAVQGRWLIKYETFDPGGMMNGSALVSHAMYTPFALPVNISSSAL